MIFIPVPYLEGFHRPAAKNMKIMEVRSRMNANPHILSASRYVLKHLCETLQAAAEPSVFFEIILSDPGGNVLAAMASHPAQAVFPAGSRLPRGLLDHRDAVASHSRLLGGKPNSYTMAPIASSLFHGFLLFLTDRAEAADVSIVKTWVDLILNRANLDCSVEKVLTHNEQMMRIFDTMQDGCMATDNHGVVTFINQAGAEIFGMQTQEIIGRHVVDTFKFEPEILKVLKHGQGWIDREFHIKLPSGAQVHLIKSAIPVYDEARRIIGVVDTFRKFNKIRRLVSNISGTRGLLTFDNLVGESPAILGIIAQAKKAAVNLSTVLLQGESGTGKELFAQAIHNASSRRDGPFVVIDCSSLPRELIESELFGYVEGTFTGAYKNGRPGKFELADGGTVFLDEIGEMPLDLQTRLLRVLQSRIITRLGTCTAIPVDIRVIAASSKNLRDELAKQRFRSDLFYRLNIVSLQLPPLRRRKEDIPLLTRHFIRKIGQRMNRPGVAISQAALQLCEQYEWPGNVRELENTIERAFSLLDGNRIELEHLPEELHQPCLTTGSQLAAPSLRRLADVEWETVLDALEQTQGNRLQAAKLLGISRSALYDKLKNHHYL